MSKTERNRENPERLPDEPIGEYMSRLSALVSGYNYTEDAIRHQPNAVCQILRNLKELIDEVAQP